MLKPPQYLEFPVKWLLPPAYRETVLGDLQERYQSPLHYVADAATAVPAAVFSQIVRNGLLQLLLLEGFAVYVAMLAAAVCLWRLEGTPNLLQAACSTGVILAGLLFRHVYFNPAGATAKWRVIDPGIYLTVYFSSGIQWLWLDFHPQQNLFPPIITTCLGVFLSAFVITLVGRIAPTKGARKKTRS